MLSPINNGFTLDRSVYWVDVLKIISLEAIIARGNHLDESIHLYKIDWSKSQIELLHKKKGFYNSGDLMKHSSLIYDSNGKHLLNYYSSPVENCVSKIAMA
jgi:hypothetical protein